MIWFTLGQKSLWEKEEMLITSIISYSNNISKTFFNSLQHNLDLNPLPDEKFQTSKLKEFADDNFKFDENGRKLSKWVENTVGKGEIAR